MLNLDRRRSFHPEHEDAWLWAVRRGRPRPLNLFRLRMVRDLRADDVGPASDELGGGKTLLGERRGERSVENFRQRSREGFAGLVHAARLCHIAPYDASSWDRPTKARRIAAPCARGRSLGLVRPPPSRAALARRAGRAARPVSGLALRDHAAADHDEGGRAVFRALYRALVERAGDFAQALMDLGATICTPKTPTCALCPWRSACAARRRGDPEAFPLKAPKREGRLRRGAAFVVLRSDGFVLVRSRPPKGLLGGMTEVPTTQWTHDFDGGLELAPRLGRAQPRWRRVAGVVTHTFTHFPLE